MNVSALLADSKRISEDLVSALSDEARWKIVKKSDDITIAVSPSSYMSEKMYRSDCIMPCSPAHLLAMVTPVKPYRTQWDPFLEEAVLLNTVHKNVYVFHHKTPPAFKGAVTARDSIDVVTIGIKDDAIFVAAGTPVAAMSVALQYPAEEGRVRTTQHPAGYLIRPVEGEPDKCRFNMCFHVDLNMSQLVSLMATMIKPTLMIDKIKALRKALPTTQLTADDLQLDL